MPILEPSPPEPAIIDAIREVRLPMADEHVDAAIRFYRDLLGLKPWPERLQLPGTLGFGDFSRGLMLVSRHAIIAADAVRRRITVRVSAIEQVEKALLENEISVQRFRGFFLSDDLLATVDPGGNRVDVRPMRRF